MPPQKKIKIASKWLISLKSTCRKWRELSNSRGLDTFVGDPISGFCLQSADYLRLGERLARVGLPTVLVLEGGYAVDGLGVNAANVLQAFA